MERESEPAPTGGRRLAASLGWLLACLAVLEVGSRAASPLRELPSASEVARNPLFRRGWPEYTRGGAPAERRVVVIGNSQEFGPEVLPEHTYTARLRALLDAGSASGSDWTVENWGVGGAIAHDLLILLARAISQRPRLIVVSTYSQNFTDHIEEGIFFSISDVPYLVADPGVATRLPVDFLRRRVGVEGLLRATAYRRLALLRSRRHLWEWLQWRYPHEAYSVLYGRNWGSLETFWLAPPLGGFSQSAADFERHRGTPFGVLSRKDWKPPRIDYFDYLLETASHAAPHTKIVFVLMPLRRDLLDEILLNETLGFNRSFTRAMGEAGYPVWDLSWSLDPSHFYGVQHLAPPNHERFAELLAQRLHDRELID